MPTKEEPIWKFLSEKLDIHSRNALYLEAFNHEIPEGSGENNNERLAYLGDRVINLIIAERLFEVHRNAGTYLTPIGAILQSDECFAEVFARVLDVKYIFSTSYPSQKKGIQTMRAKAFEAFFGAIYLDQGIEKCNNIYLQWESVFNEVYDEIKKK